MVAAGVLTHGVGADGAKTSEPRMKDQDSQRTVVFDFGSHAEPWPNIDDPVMGGLSRSTMVIKPGVAVFEGFVSLENNGGFASLRSGPAEHDLSSFVGIVLRVRGDGKVYGVRLRTDGRFDGVSYQAKIATEAGCWTEMELPFAGPPEAGKRNTFRPVFRGRVVKGYPPLDPAAITSFGLIISDRQEGPFRLEIDWIKAYRE